MNILYKYITNSLLFIAVLFTFNTSVPGAGSESASSKTSQDSNGQTRFKKIDPSNGGKVALLSDFDGSSYTYSVDNNGDEYVINFNTGTKSSPDSQTGLLDGHSPTSSTDQLDNMARRLSTLNLQALNASFSKELDEKQRTNLIKELEAARWIEFKARQRSGTSESSGSNDDSIDSCDLPMQNVNFKDMTNEELLLAKEGIKRFQQDYCFIEADNERALRVRRLSAPWTQFDKPYNEMDEEELAYAERVQSNFRDANAITSGINSHHSFGVEVLQRQELLSDHWAEFEEDGEPVNIKDMDSGQLARAQSAQAKHRNAYCLLDISKKAKGLRKRRLQPHHTFIANGEIVPAESMTDEQRARAEEELRKATTFDITPPEIPTGCWGQTKAIYRKIDEKMKPLKGTIAIGVMFPYQAAIHSVDGEANVIEFFLQGTIGYLIQDHIVVRKIPKPILAAGFWVSGGLVEMTNQFIIEPNLGFNPFPGVPQSLLLAGFQAIFTDAIMRTKDKLQE